MEDFLTLQGEGYYQGTSAYFLRLGGCDVGCVWCDVKESWPAEKHPLVSTEIMADRAAQSGAPIAVVTGGEPGMYNLSGLTAALKQRGLRTHLETSGAYPITGEWDWVCLSPKKFKQPDATSYGKADELKVVVYHPSDLAWAEKEATHVRPACRLYLQPEWSREKEMVPLIIDYIKRNPKWRISLQVHKYLNIP
ncbi:MAG: 4Fe-4S cluster-binding domain-containing protein [Cyclobacteriaceae bacterium]|nr:4Fe-4S cluster-binding domain-containing protein [Cyclobacteriaceae bacterium]